MAKWPQPTLNTEAHVDRKPIPLEDDGKPKRVVIHPEIYKLLLLESARTRRPIQYLAHWYLCLGMERHDLLDLLEASPVTAAAR